MFTRDIRFNCVSVCECYLPNADEFRANGASGNASLGDANSLVGIERERQGGGENGG